MFVLLNIMVRTQNNINDSYNNNINIYSDNRNG